MEKLEIFTVINLFWPIAIAILGAITSKLIPFMRTKIFTYKHYNSFTCFLLAEYELISISIAPVIITVLVVIFGKSTWDNMIFREYIIGWFGVAILYVVGIFWIVKNKTEKGKQKYTFNIIIGVLLYFIMSAYYWLCLMNVLQSKKNIELSAILIVVLMAQTVFNLKSEKVKSVHYIVIVNKKRYKTLYEPIKRGRYYYIRITDKNGNEIKRVQVPEDNVETIEHIIESVEK